MENKDKLRLTGEFLKSCVSKQGYSLNLSMLTKPLRLKADFNVVGAERFSVEVIKQHALLSETFDVLPALVAKDKEAMTFAYHVRLDLHALNHAVEQLRQAGISGMD